MPAPSRRHSSSPMKRRARAPLLLAPPRKRARLLAPGCTLLEDLVDDALGVVASFLYSPRDYGHFAATNRRLQRLLLAPGLLVPMRETYFVPWGRVILRRHTMTLAEVPVQTPELCLAAVQQDVGALRWVKQQTPEICLAAVQKRVWALTF